MSLIMLLIMVGLGLLIPTAYAGYIGAPYAPTRIAVVKRAFDLIDVGPNDLLVDLGAGDGKIVREAAKRGASARGYELSPIMWAVAWLRTYRFKRAHIIYRNFYTQVLPSDTTVIFAFLMPDNMPKVRRLLARQQFPQAKYCLAYAFPFADATPLNVVRVPQCAPLYVYDLRELTHQNSGRQSWENVPS